MIVTVLLFIVILGLLIFVHEMGHFVAARRMGIAIEEFGFGYPPRILGIQRLNGQKKKWRFIKGRKTPEDNDKSEGRTIYSLNWIPIGGFVKIKGEQGDKASETDSFTHKKIWQRAIVLSAGVIMNFLLAVVIISIGFSIGLPAVINETISSRASVQERKIQIIEIEENSPAAQAELKMGDFILAAGNTEYIYITDFQSYTKPRLNQEITLTIRRGQEIFEKKLVPADLNNKGEGMVGAWLAETGIVSYPWYESIWMGAKTTVLITWEILKAFFEIIKNLITSQPVAAEIAGPIGIAVITGQVAQLGFIYVLQFVAILSINLAIINFIPFPALDGGRFLFLMIEKIRGKPLKQQVEGAIHNIGFFLLIGLIIIVTFKDFSRFGDSIKGFFSNIFG